MTRKQLEAVHEALTEIIDSWNDAAADEDRGRSNDALVLTLDDDGSGSLGRRVRAWEYGVPDSVEDLYDFRDVGELLDVLANREGVELEPD